MCGVWLALEDVHEDAGPLVYYPGSHKWPILYNDLLGVRITGNKGGRAQSVYDPVWEQLVAKHGLEPMHFLPKKGEALIWLANLLHGGARQRDPQRTRWSQVTHYFFDNCCYITPMLSDVLIGKLFVRDMIDISSGEPVPNIYIDVPLSQLEHSPDIVLPADFDGTRYLELNVDVARAGAERLSTISRSGLVRVAAIANCLLIRSTTEAPAYAGGRRTAYDACEMFSCSLPLDCRAKCNTA